MEGTSAGPYFETCPPNSVDGRVFGQCSATTVDWLDVGVSVGVVAVGVGIFVYFFLRWVNRRHASVMGYVRKKLDDISRLLSNLSLMPPFHKARFYEFSIIVLIVSIVLLYLNGAFGGSALTACDFTSQFYLDLATSITLTLDHCDVKFVPASNFPFPTSAISAIEIRVAYTLGDPLITLSADTCTAQASITLANYRPDASMFTDFYCSVEVIVPDRAVIPEFTIIATGPNTTTVRAGSMDSDTPFFSLDFGPNPLILTGNYLQARLENITTKRFEYTADHGGLIATDMGAIGPIPTALFQSVDGDLIVTTTQRTSVRYWQKSANAVCLTAANNSAYLSSACKTTCSYPGPNETAPSPVEVQGATFCPLIPRYPCPRCPADKISTIPGCVDHTTCTANETLLCECKPGCEMVTLESHSAKSTLDGTTIVPTAAYCDIDGRCCLTFCYGYSSADLLPIPNEPQCGRCVDPVNMPWSPGALDQQWVFFSETGQISLTVLDSTDPPSVSSYAGAVPGSSVPSPQISDQDLSALSLTFHAEGGPAPAANWFEFDITGPGAPERTRDGVMVWIQQIWLSVLPLWFINLLFSDILAPIQESARASLNPGFCPAYVPPGSAEALNRLVVLNTLLTDGLEQYPAGSQYRIFPSGSQLVYRDVSGTNNLFFFDPTTSTTSVTPIVPLSFYTIILITAIGLLVPLILSMVVSILIGYFYYKELEAFRTRRLSLDKNIENLTREMQVLLTVVRLPTKINIALLRPISACKVHLIE